jgi:hypothetical protein
MLTGRRAFAGVDVADTLVQVLTQDPDWTPLSATAPPLIGRLIRRCLEKDRNRRLADAADARLEIDEALTPRPATDGRLAPPSPGSRRRVVGTVVAALLVGAAIGALGTWALRHPAPPSASGAPEMRLDVATLPTVSGRSLQCAPVPLFAARKGAGHSIFYRWYKAAPDGQRFIVHSIPESAGTQPITVVLNFTRR